ncbi:DUF3530 family protein [Pseudoalteromonas sp. NBT06-2]|uniref:DUF3530 family protein n=1 Tax=Pseudoalteromonas sp. NBT06-2 TaxID=2025950 RepID=UPI0014828098|nr:DUF3530 family protein [Pseudoalteromonas sp. NBT06-2]
MKRIHCYIYSFVLFFISSTCLATETKNIEIKAPPSLESIYQQDLYHYLQGDEVKQILAGDIEFTALFRDHTAAQAKGIAILFPDWSLPANNQLGLDYLRKALNDYGWVSYALNVPDQIPLNTATALSNETLFHAPTLPILSDTELKTYKLLLISRLKAIYQKALEHPGFIIIIAQGSTSAMIVEFFADKPEEEIDAMILLSGYLPDPALNKNLTNTIANVTAPVLDIYHTHDNNWVLSEVSNRKKANRKAHKLDYRQRELFGNNASSTQHARLLKEIYGFLTKIGI